MHANRTADLVRRYFAAFESKDRLTVEELLAEDFTFTSPLDDHINRARYFERCWPLSELDRSFHILNLLESANEAFVRYECELPDHGSFINTEYFRAEGGRIREICVYFGADTAPAESTVESQIRALIETWGQAVRDKDLHARLANHAPDVVTFDALPPLRRVGTAGIQERLQEWFAGYEGPIGYEIRDLHVTADNDVAFSHSLNRVSGTLTGGGKVDMWVRDTSCFRNVQGKWMATHTHVSVPFDAKAGKAALDLKP